MRARCLLVLALLACTSPAFAQQRPLVTEDPEPIGAGRILIEGGVDFADDQQYPTSGLRGNLWRLPALGFSFGLSSIAEFQIDGGLLDRLGITARDPTAPLASLVTATGDSTNSFADVVVGTKIRLVAEATGRPAFGLRFATKLPTASNESGLGTDSMDFAASVLAAKTVQSVRIVANIGAAILSDPTEGNRQNDVLTYGGSFARALSQRSELVGELNGRLSTRSDGPFPGTESRALLRFGGRFTQGPVRLDAGVFFGLTTIDPSIGFTAGFTYVFNAFRVP
jgi:Putative MetA-pathway of phenol degradation